MVHLGRKTSFAHMRRTPQRRRSRAHGAGLDLAVLSWRSHGMCKGRASGRSSFSSTRSTWRRVGTSCFYRRSSRLVSRRLASWGSSTAALRLAVFGAISWWLGPLEWPSSCTGDGRDPSERSSARRLPLAFSSEPIARAPATWPSASTSRRHGRRRRSTPPAWIRLQGCAIEWRTSQASLRSASAGIGTRSSPGSLRSALSSLRPLPASARLQCGPLWSGRRGGGTRAPERCRSVCSTVFSCRGDGAKRPGAYSIRPSPTGPSGS